MTGPPTTEVDLLLLGRDRDRRRLPRRIAVLIGVLLTALLVSGVVVDQRARAVESARLDTCASRTHAAVHDATARMAGILNYVKPVWSYRVPRHVERSLDAMVSRSATGADQPLVRVRRSCGSVEVGALHPGLRARQAACVQLLDTFAGFLRRIAHDASAASGEWPEDDVQSC